ncbi:MAG: hypothetical protein ABSA84_05785 [Gammaproteobacteria bacterium]|jgi:hypothetical protein
MNINNDLVVLQEELANCKIHVERIKMALRRTSDLFPFTEQRLNNLNVIQYYK